MEDEIDKAISLREEKPKTIELFSDSDKLYIGLIQKEMHDTLESGELKPEQQYVYIDSVLQRLVLLKNNNINIVIKKYFDDSNKLDDDFKEFYKFYIDKKADIAKEIYEEIKKL